MIAKALWFAVFVSGLNQTAVFASGQPTPDPNQTHGVSDFLLPCSACHGADGKRKGTEENLRLHQSDRTIGLSAAELLLPINNGGSGTAMPVWVGKLSVEENFEVAGQPCPWWGR